MPLSRSTLFQGLKELPRRAVPTPRGNNQAARAFAKVLEEYFREGQAGDTVVILSFASLVPFLLETMIRRRFIQELGSSIQKWALTWSWSSPNFTGIPGTTRAQGVILDASLGVLTLEALADKSDPPRDNTSQLAGRIHNWAKGANLIVTLTNNSSGTTSPNPVF